MMPELVRRVGQFAEEEGQPGVGIISDLVHNFVAPILPQAASFRPWMRAWCLCSENGIVGHVVGEVNYDHGNPFCVVTQYASDDGSPFPRESIVAVWDDLMSWAGTLGAKKVNILARSEIHAKAYAAFYKLKPVGKVLMERAIEKPGGGGLNG